MVEVFLSNDPFFCIKNRPSLEQKEQCGASRPLSAQWSTAEEQSYGFNSVDHRQLSLEDQKPARALSMSGHYVSRTAIFNTVPEAANSQWILVKSKEKGRKVFFCSWMGEEVGIRSAYCVYTWVQLFLKTISL